jgi:hypothetical protein
MSARVLTVEAELEKLQRVSFSYFLNETNPVNGLVIDKTATDWPASIAATGLALAAYPVAVDRGFMPRAAAIERTLTTLRFFWNSPQGPEFDATGYHTIKVSGIERQFFDYLGRGGPYGPDDGTIAPWAVVMNPVLLCPLKMPGKSKTPI